MVAHEQCTDLHKRNRNWFPGRTKNNSSSLPGNVGCYPRLNAADKNNARLNFEHMNDGPLSTGCQ
jgi:hypothetical protein